MVTMGSYPLQGVITLLLPHFFGSYADGTMWVGNVPWSIPHQNLYTGILPIVLLGFVSLQWKEKKRTVLFGALLALLALVLAFGHHTPLYRFVYLLPGFDRFRAPSKIIVLWGFSIALMAGVGMDGLLRYLREKYTCRLSVLFFLVISFIVLDLVFLADSSRILRFFSPFLLPDAVPGKMVEAAGIVFSSFHRLTILSSFLLLFGLLMRRNLLPVSLGAASLCAFLLVDLAHVHSNAVRHDDAIYQTMNRIERSLADSLGRDRTPYRVGSFPHALGADFEMYLGYQTVNGFTALFPSRYYEYMNAYSENRLPLGWVDFFYGTTHNSVLMDLLNVKYEISHAAKSYGLRESFLPRAFLVPEYDVLEKSEVLHRLVHPDFDPKRTVLFEKEDHPSDLRPRGSSEPGPPGLARILSYRPDRMVVETDSPDFRYLFLSEMSYPGWNAFVDGQPTRILRGNYLFRVLEIPGGRHQVILEFDPWTIKAGTGITLLTVLLILGIPLFLRLRRKASLR